MARNENPPFPRGATWYNGGTIDANNLGGANLEGKEWLFEDLDFSATGTPPRTGRYVRCRIVRNVSAGAILPKRCVTFKVTAGQTYGQQVDGYCDLTAERAYPVDEWLPAAGCPANDLCWIVVDGPATVRTDIAAAAGNVITVGDWVVALTAASSGATTSGRISVQDLTGATTPLATQIQNRIGRALSAATTANTNSDLLIELGQW